MSAPHHYADRLHAAVRSKGTPALVGIDPRLKSLPAPVLDAATGPTELERFADAFERFGKGLIDAVADLVPAVKPQSAFFEELGPPGVAALSRVIAHARAAGLIVILDAKRGDIGSTAEAYARGLLGGVDPPRPDMADALTVNPFLGPDTLEPFVNVARERGAGLYVLCKTSNPLSGKYQDAELDGVSTTNRIAAHLDLICANSIGETGYGFVGAVVGATYPAELTDLRNAMPCVPLLVPGYGSQGGSAADVAGAFDEKCGERGGLGALINSSRAVNFAFSAEPFAAEFGPARWQEASAAAARAMVEDLRAIVR
ncbi:orotidine-5'-phosphate decarboxylase [Alienimonas chondri]|uniref:Orotidine 5'-phosphate decarboxylase n=1 Tax=Alienimonas chondri TaxID=2681879 RepID=A0ABX1VBT6_9PLAN|nr:orotidine-5'-phosphate decarboxylase [Alienimonas chondri]NNJ25569.1 Orotidine 5'-phosphate decarboxylase [Alienimonas chondri]